MDFFQKNYGFLDIWETNSENFIKIIKVEVKQSNNKFIKYYI